jgi:hypothetical protein
MRITMQSRTLGRRVSDEFAVPLCRTHHLPSTDEATSLRACVVAGSQPRSGRA